jgi:hypothetical protein
LALAVASAFLALGVVTAAASAAPPSPSVTGSGNVVLPSGFPVAAFVGDTVQIELSARHLPDGSIQGEFNFHHHSRNGGLVADLHGTVTCLNVVGNRANATGIVDHGQLFLNPAFNPAGQVVALSAVDNDPDRVGFDLSFFPGPHSIAPCQPAPFLLPVASGNFEIHS